LGFVVSDSGSVLVDHSISSFGDTRISHNPTSATTLCQRNPLLVHSVFIRHGYKGNRVPGDNCPLIYGLKKKEGLSVEYNAVKTLLPSLEGILNKFIREREDNNVSYDLIIPMPSSHSISKILARRTQRLFPQANLLLESFRKSNGDDIKQQLLQDSFGAKSIPHGASINIINAVNKANDSGNEFSLSDVNMNNRLFISPLTQIQELPNVNSVLLIDDLYASGQTLITAKDCILEQLPQAKVEALSVYLAP